MGAIGLLYKSFCQANHLIPGPQIKPGRNYLTLRTNVRPLFDQSSSTSLPRYPLCIRTLWYLFHSLSSIAWVIYSAENKETFIGTKFTPWKAQRHYSHWGGMAGAEDIGDYMFNPSSGGRKDRPTARSLKEWRRCWSEQGSAQVFPQLFGLLQIHWICPFRALPRDKWQQVLKAWKDK